MNENELLTVWGKHNEKLNEVISINKAILRNTLKQNLNSTIGQLRSPYNRTILLGVPYTVVLYILAFIGYTASAPFVFVGFAAIALFMTILLAGYIYQTRLIHQIQSTDEIIQVQENLARLKLSNYRLTRMAIWQLPFWSICWVSLNALKSDPWLYGVVNFGVFIILTSISFYLFRGLSIKNRSSRIYEIFMSGRDWEQINKSHEIIEEIIGTINTYKD